MEIMYIILGILWAVSGNVLFLIKKKQLKGQLRTNAIDIIASSIGGLCMISIFLPNGTIKIN